jgi:hypothetical protein
MTEGLSTSPGKVFPRFTAEMDRHIGSAHGAGNTCRSHDWHTLGRDFCWHRWFLSFICPFGEKSHFFLVNDMQLGKTHSPRISSSSYWTTTRRGLRLQIGVQLWISKNTSQRFAFSILVSISNVMLIHFSEDFFPLNLELPWKPLQILLRLVPVL